MYRLDKTVFSIGNHQEAEENQRTYWQNKSMRERLKAAMYLNSIAYDFDVENPPKMDRTAFSIRKHEV